jgi:hypothetical protein
MPALRAWPRGTREPRHRNAVTTQVQIIIIMRAILLLAVGAAALKAPKQTALAVRGGGDDSTNEIIMKVSAAAATASGALTILDKSDLVEKYIFFGLNPATSGAAYGVALLGWGVGKINAVQSGAESIKNFAKLNLIPMACWIATNFQNDAPMTENIFPGLFAAAYAYIVWG